MEAASKVGHFAIEWLADLKRAATHFSYGFLDSWSQVYAATEPRFQESK
jgi:hypothetical protein